MIDPHAHLRDWSQSHKETLKHGLKITRIENQVHTCFLFQETEP